METSSDEARRDDPGAASILKVLRRPEVVGPVCAVLGLCTGIVIGRESIPVEPESRKTGAIVSRQGAMTAAAPEAVRDEEVPSGEYRSQLGARLPKKAHGFEPLSLPGRRVAQLGAEEASLPFELTAVDEDYALTAIVYVNPGSSAKLEARLDGKALAPGALSEGLNIYYSPVPRESLANASHTLVFRAGSGAKTAVVGIDSVALAPVADEARFNFGPKAIGFLVEGFSKPGGESAWSDGPRSVLAIPLRPEQTPYQLTVRGGALSHLAPLTVTAKVNGIDLGTAVFAKKVTENEWAVPTEAIRPGPNRVEFTYAQTARPTEYNPNSKDKRLLALRFYSVALEPER